MKSMMECEQSLQHFGELLSELTSEKNIELKLRRIYEYCSQYATIDEAPILETSEQNLLLMENSPGDFLAEESLQNDNAFGKLTPDFPREPLDDDWQGQSILRPEAIFEKIRSKESLKGSSTKHMRSPRDNQNFDCNIDIVRKNSRPSNGKIRFESGMTLQKLAQNFDDNDLTPQIPNEAECIELMKSLRKSLPFKLYLSENTSPSLSSLEISMSEIIPYDISLSDALDAKGSGDVDSDCNYEITDHSLSESSNQSFKNFEYRDELGQRTDSERIGNMTRFINYHRGPNKAANFNDHLLQFVFGKKSPDTFVIQNENAPNRAHSPLPRLFYGSKQIPRWAEAPEKIAKTISIQKETGLHFATFGVMEPISQLNLEDILGPSEENRIARSESVIWLTPESTDRRVKRMSDDRAMQNISMREL